MKDPSVWYPVKCLSRIGLPHISSLLTKFYCNLFIARAGHPSWPSLPLYLQQATADLQKAVQHSKRKPENGEADKNRRSIGCDGALACSLILDEVMRRL